MEKTKNENNYSMKEIMDELGIRSGYDSDSVNEARELLKREVPSLIEINILSAEILRLKKTAKKQQEVIDSLGSDSTKLFDLIKKQMNVIRLLAEEIKHDRTVSNRESKLMQEMLSTDEKMLNTMINELEAEEEEIEKEELPKLNPLKRGRGRPKKVTSSVLPQKALPELKPLKRGRKSKVVRLTKKVQNRMVGLIKAGAKPREIKRVIKDEFGLNLSTARIYNKVYYLKKTRGLE